MNSITYVGVSLLAFVLGQWLVTRGHWSGFLVWCLANLYSALTGMVAGTLETSCLFGAYFVANLVSLRSWFASTRSACPANRALDPARRPAPE